MALRIKDRVKQGTTTTGSGTISLDVSFSSSGFQDFSVLGNGTETYYAIEEGSNFEIGLGTYNSNTLSRSTILDSSNGGAKIALNGNVAWQLRSNGGERFCPVDSQNLTARFCQCFPISSAF